MGQEFSFRAHHSRGSTVWLVVGVERAGDYPGLSINPLVLRKIRVRSSRSIKDTVFHMPLEAIRPSRTTTTTSVPQQ